MLNQLILYGICGDDYDDRSVASDLATITGDVEVRINSGGGNLLAGLAIYNSLRRHDGRITTTIEGGALSAASFIALAGEHRRMASNALFMVHDPLVANVGGGNAHDLRKTADMLDKARDAVLAIYVERTQLSASRLTEMMRNETWLDARECLSLGLVHELVGEMAPLAAEVALEHPSAMAVIASGNNSKPKAHKPLWPDLVNETHERLQAQRPTASRLDAMRAVERQHPGLRQQFLDNANGV